MVVNNKKGQAVFEFVLFLPIFITLYFFLVNIGGSINGSINQQKVTRGYFYARIKNNSTLPVPNPDSPGNPVGAWQRFGMQYVGWREQWASGGEVPQTNCYKLALPLGKEDSDDCEQWNENTTQFVRPRTVYGVCGATYLIQGGFSERDTQVSDVGSCLLK